MPITYVTTSSVGPGTRSLAANEDLYIASGVDFISTTGNAISANGADVDIFILGHVSGTYGVFDSASQGYTAVIYAGASVVGTAVSGLDCVGDAASITNFGSIWGNVSGVYFGSDTGHLTNHGVIRGTERGVLLLVSAPTERTDMTNSGTVDSGVTGVYLVGSGTAYISNSGLIQGALYGVSNRIPGNTPTNTQLRLTNDGEIRGAQPGSFWAVISGDAADLIANSGVIFGDVGTSGGSDRIDNRLGRIDGQIEMGDANDFFDNRSGLLMGRAIMGGGDDTIDNRNGTIFDAMLGGTGADTFRLGAGIEIIDGGTDFDSIDFRGTPAVTVALDESLPNTDHAAGDEYAGIEGIYGSYFADLLVGSSGANTLRGYGGNDTMNGGAGSDKLVGGNGIDTITTGAGSDTFIFDRLSETGDVITDFNAATDVFNIRASAFGGGLVAGVLAATQFQSRADNVAQDGDDRFIFRTTDRTIWFDADGNGAGAAILVADLQAGATVTVADIVLV